VSKTKCGHAAAAQGNDIGTGLRRAIALATLVVASAAVVAGINTARAATYKWVDEKGVVHYTDTMPPEAVDKASVELNKSGIPIKKTDKALTPEQRRALELDAERQRLAARQQEEVARRDRALLSSYTSEAEIDLARNRSLQTINTAVQSAQAFSEQLSKRKVEIEAKKIELQGKPAAAALDRELESIDAELLRQSDLVAQKKRESVVIIAKYDADRQRWRELVNAKAAADPAKSASAQGASVTGPTKK
jgi:hypothetical protein